VFEARREKVQVITLKRVPRELVEIVSKRLGSL
jgi:hypothetical protein